MFKARNRGLTFSALLHVLLLILAIFGLPSFFDSPPIVEPTVISVEILPITGITNVKPSDKAAPDAPKPEEKPLEKKAEPKEEKKEPEKPKPKPPTPPVKKVEPPAPPKPETKKTEKPTEKKIEKKPEPKPDDKKTKAKAEDLDAILKAVKDEAQKQKKTEPTTKDDAKDAASEKKNLSSRFDPNQQMSLSERDAIRSQIAKCWVVPAGAKNAHELIITLDLQLETDGTVIKVELANESKSRYSSDNFFRAAADSAMRAVRQCSPLKNLAPEKYASWRDMELRFDPQEMLY